MQLADDHVKQAYTSLSLKHGCSVDDILVDPAERSDFLDLVWEQAGNVPEHLVLRRLLNLRKRSLLPRSYSRQAHNL
jgi:hypothetical protein